MTDQRRHAPATERNRDPILAILREVLPAHLPVGGTVLEIASGTGEHAIHFARALPGLVFQPSDPDPDALASIRGWAMMAKLNNVRPPLLLDAAAPDWPIARADAMLCINMVHISPWEATVGLMRQAARLLPTGGPLILYGPYLREGVETAASNVAFDADLRRRNPAWGIRRLEDVVALAAGEGLALEKVHEMPANNVMVMFWRGRRWIGRGARVK